MTSLTAMGYTFFPGPSVIYSLIVFSLYTK